MWRCEHNLPVPFVSFTSSWKDLWDVNTPLCERFRPGPKMFMPPRFHCTALLSIIKAYLYACIYSEKGLDLFIPSINEKVLIWHYPKINFLYKSGRYFTGQYNTLFFLVCFFAVKDGRAILCDQWKQWSCLPRWCTDGNVDRCTIIFCVEDLLRRICHHWHLRKHIIV